MSVEPNATDHTDTDRAVCPYCGHRHEGSWDWPDDNRVCHGCGRMFEVESYTERFFSTRPLVRCPACGAFVRARKDGLTRVHYAPGAGLTPCVGGRGVPQS